MEISNNHITIKKLKNMKKYFILAAAALVALTACTKMELDETATPDVKIGFEVANYMSQTKADGSSFLTELTNMGATTKAFKSSAFIHPNGSSFGNFFNPNPETITWNTTSTEWEPSKDYYWPKSPSSNIDFFSWYDFDGTATDPTLTYDGSTAPTLAWTNRTVEYKSDILFADIAWHQTANQARNQLDGVASGVPTLFHHALAQVKFQAKIKEEKDKKADSKNSGYYTFFEVKLSAFTLPQVHKNGTLSLTKTYESSKTTTAWTVPSPAIWANATSATLVNTPNDWFTTAAATGSEVLTTAAYSALNATNYMPDGFIAVRPQAVTNDMKLTFTISITKWYGTQTQFNAEGHSGCTNLGTEVFPVTDFATTADDAYTANGLQLNKIANAPANWEMNKRIIYNIIIDPTTDTILFDPAVVDWDTANYDVEVPKPAE